MWHNLACKAYSLLLRINCALFYVKSSIEQVDKAITASDKEVTNFLGNWILTPPNQLVKFGDSNNEISYPTQIMRYHML